MSYPINHRGTVAERFWAKVNKLGDCWEWTACRYPSGYGQFDVLGKRRRAHRVSWELANGEIPEGMKVLHKCDNPACVRPSHLFLGTSTDNMQDCKNKGRTRNGVRFGEQNHMTTLTPQDIVHIRNEIGKSHQKLIAKKYGVTESSISKIKLRKTWGHVCS